jgi:nucleoside-diphosphate-sugar epimerase
MEKVLITGGNGTVGTAIAKELDKKDYYLLGIDLCFEDDQYFNETREADLTQQTEKIHELFCKSDVVIHSAWDLEKENFDTGTKWEGNIQMFENVLECVKSEKVGTFVNISSIHAGAGGIHPYCPNPKGLEEVENQYIKRSLDFEDQFLLKDDQPDELIVPGIEKPNSKYAESKIQAEHMSKKAAKQSAYPELAVSIRLGGVNPDDNPKKDDRHPAEQPYYPIIYLSHSDLGNLIEKIINAEKEGYEQINAVSGHPQRIYSIKNSFGWTPEEL